MRSGDDIRLQTEAGTDLTFSGITLTPDDGPLVPGGWRPFPYGGVNFYPDTCDGVFVIEDSTATGVPEERCAVTMTVREMSAIAIAAKGEPASRCARSKGRAASARTIAPPP